MFDGSAMEGFVRIDESDMHLYPDLDAFGIFPRRLVSERGWMGLKTDAASAVRGGQYVCHGTGGDKRKGSRQRIGKQADIFTIMEQQ